MKYTGRFEGWAKTKENEINAEIAQLREEIGDLEKKIAQIKAALIGLGIAAGAASVAIPILGVVAYATGPFAPFVVAFGAFVAIGTVASAIGLGVSLKGFHPPVLPPSVFPVIFVVL